MQQKVVAFDTETALIHPGKLAPELACVSWCDGTNRGLLDADEGIAKLWSWLIDPNVILVGHNLAYDTAVIVAYHPDLLPLVIRKYEAGLFADTMIREQLILNAAGRFKGWRDENGIWTYPRLDLAGLAERHLSMYLDKDTWRMRYGELIGVDPRGPDLADLPPGRLPLRDWPEGAKEYPIYDAVATHGVYTAQEEVKEFIPDHLTQTRWAFWKHMSSCRGLLTDPRAVLKFKSAVEEEIEAIREELVQAGLVRSNGVRDTKATKDRMVEVCKAEGLPLRKTKTGGIELSADACDATDDHLLMTYAEFSALGSMLSKDIPMLLAGITKPIHTRYGMAESGRTTSSSNKKLGRGTGNLQNLRRGAKKKKGETNDEFEEREARFGDIRGCFVPRPGYTFIQADYGGLELATLAQACVTLFGSSRLADALNAGQDPHCIVAAKILGKTYEETVALVAAKDYEAGQARQAAKVANFGFPGGLGPDKLALFARKNYGVTLSVAQARDLKRIWFDAYPEMHRFFEYVSERADEPIVQLFSKRIRKGGTYCAKCNTIFQGLGADASQEAGWQIMKACYDEFSPLYGSRIVLYIHDEYILETPLTADLTAACHELERLMVEGAKKYLPDVAIKAPPLAMSVWSKKAELVRNEKGEIIPWKPKHDCTGFEK